METSRVALHRRHARRVPSPIGPLGTIHACNVNHLALHLPSFNNLWLFPHPLAGWPAAHCPAIPDFAAGDTDARAGAAHGFNEPAVPGAQNRPGGQFDPGHCRPGMGFSNAGPWLFSFERNGRLYARSTSPHSCCSRQFLWLCWQSRLKRRSITTPALPRPGHSLDRNLPAVPGLGVLHDRLAFDSAWLVANALFSFAFLGLQSFHTLGAFLVILTAAYFADKFDRLIHSEMTLGNCIASWEYS